MLVGDLIRRKSSLVKRAWIALFERRNIEKAAAVPCHIRDRSIRVGSARAPLRALGSCGEWY